MDLDDFLEVFNTLYAVDLAGDVDGQTPMIDYMVVSKEKGLGNKRVKKHREGRCEGSWNGGVCGGRCGDESMWCDAELSKRLLPLFAFRIGLCAVTWISR